MTLLGQEVARTLAKRQGDRRLDLTTDRVDEILDILDIPTSATKAVPVPLRATRIHFRGTKQLDASFSDADRYENEMPGERVSESHGRTPVSTGASDADLQNEDAVIDGTDEPAGSTATLVPVPFSFTWEPKLGVNGIGSGRNLRGKSTILNVLMWSLTGRCARFQADVKRWIEYVEVDWRVGAEQLRVSFDSTDGRAKGQVTRLGDAERPNSSTVLAIFNDDDEFESVMGSLMMTRLRLEHIPVWTDTVARVHAWPSYSSALVVRANQLDPIVGNEQTIGVRMMQMFVGTDWAPAQAAATTARRGMDTERSVATEKAKAASDAVAEARRRSLSLVDEIKAEIGALPAGTLDVTAALRDGMRAADLSRQLNELEGRRFAQESLAKTARQQLKALKARLHADYEDALANKFFQRMRPTVCPRCTAPVTAARQAAEPERHECSVCSSDLDLEALRADRIVAASALLASDRSAVQDGAWTSEGDQGPDREEDARDETEAAQAAVEAAELAERKISDRIAELSRQLGEAVAQAETQRGALSALDTRRTLELKLARAEGALMALTQSSDPKIINPVDPMHAAVADAAEQVLKKWVKDGQDPLLKQISADIERLAARFGAESLTNVLLDGGANMRLEKGGASVTYSALTEGEKLRVKIATAIALIKHGYVENIGRHPGLLVLDSPAAEEMPESDLATMVEALQAVAEEAEMQIFVATRNAKPLVELLPEANRVVAVGDAYVW